jgi:hypothetical protein
MTETKPKIEGKHHSRRPVRNVGPARKEFLNKVLGLESHTFDIGNAKYMAKYQKTVDAIANHIQKENNGGPEIAKAIRDLSLPTISAILECPRPSSLTAAIDPGEVFLRHQDVTKAKKKIALLDENKKHSYALVLSQCSPELESKIKGADSYVFDNNQQSIYALECAKHCISTCYQDHKVTTTEYVGHFKALVCVVETYGGTYGNKLGLIKG